MLKIKNKLHLTLLEPIILFSVLFLPGYFSQNIQVTDFSIFNNLNFNITFIVTTFGQILLMLYVIKLKPERKLSDYSILNFRFIDIPKAIIVYLGIFLCFFIVGIISTFLEPQLDNSIIYGEKWIFDSPRLLPLILISCILTGYNEEIFFRSYLYTSLTAVKTPAITSIILISILFGAGHIYEGYFAFAATTVIGVFLSWSFLKTKSIHAVSIGHGLYNFTILVLALREGIQ